VVLVVGAGLSAALAMADPPTASAATAATDAAARLIFLTFMAASPCRVEVSG
jgi:hypothetical protein